MHLAEGDEAGGKVALSRALKLAHGELQDHQMVSQVITSRPSSPELTEHGR